MQKRQLRKALNLIKNIFWNMSVELNCLTLKVKCSKEVLVCGLQM